MSVMTALIFAVVLPNERVEAPCMAESWGQEVIARYTQDQNLSRLRYEARQSGDAALDEVTLSTLRWQLDDNTHFLIETAKIECVEYWRSANFRVQNAFDIMVRHSISDEGDSRQLAERVEAWYTQLHSEQKIDAVSVGGLRDRLLMFENYQLYGTHRACIDGVWTYDPPLHQPEQLEARRDALDWPQAARPPIGGACEAG